MFKRPKAYGIASRFSPYNETYIVPAQSQTRRLTVIASVDDGWEHVSVRAEKHGNTYTPTWQEMCFVKDLFWDEEDEVIQIHPRKSEYVNMHPHVLHLWRHPDMVIPQ